MLVDTTGSIALHLRAQQNILGSDQTIEIAISFSVEFYEKIFHHLLEYWVAEHVGMVKEETTNWGRPILCTVAQKLTKNKL